MRKKKICFVAQFPPPIHGLTKAVDTLYHSQISEQFELESVDISNNKKIIKNLLKICRSKADLFYFTISQTKGGNLRDLLIFKVLELQKKRCLIHLHGGYYRELVETKLPSWQKKANYRAVSKLAGAIVLSDSLKSIFQGMIADERIHVVMNCVDDAFMLSREGLLEKEEERKSRKVRNVLYLSNFIRSKGYPVVLELAKREKDIHRDDISFHFEFAGKFFEESEKKYFDDFIKQNKLQDYVTYHGIVSGEKKVALLKQCDIFMLPTRYPNEGQPISILEAMGNGMYVITTDHSGIPDIVKNGVNGKVIRTVQSFETVLDEAIPELETVGRANWEEARSKYTQDCYVENCASVFQTVLNQQV